MHMSYISLSGPWGLIKSCNDGKLHNHNLIYFKVILCEILTILSVGTQFISITFWTVNVAQRLEHWPNCTTTESAWVQIRPGAGLFLFLLPLYYFLVEVQHY